jgi:hypothetical protein
MIESEDIQTVAKVKIMIPTNSYLFLLVAISQDALIDSHTKVQWCALQGPRQRSVFCETVDVEKRRCVCWMIFWRREHAVLRELEGQQHGLQSSASSPVSAFSFASTNMLPSLVSLKQGKNVGCRLAVLCTNR